MTFQDARDNHLNALDAAYAALRQLVADPAWTNSGYREYKSLIDRVSELLERIRKLNEAEQEGGAK